MQGVAWANLTDGRTAVVRLRSDGTWEHVLAGVTTLSFPDSDSAIQDLTLKLAGERILLRQRE